MTEYHKINTCFKRNMETDKKIDMSQWSNPAYEYLKDNHWLWDEKVDGTNIRVDWDGTDVVFGGRTDNAQVHNGIITALNSLFYSVPQKEKLKEMFPEGGVTFYGEGYGAGIQKVGINYDPKEKGFILFDIKIVKF